MSVVLQSVLLNYIPGQGLTIVGRMNVDHIRHNLNMFSVDVYRVSYRGGDGGDLSPS